MILRQYRCRGEIEGHVCELERDRKQCSQAPDRRPRKISLMMISFFFLPSRLNLSLSLNLLEKKKILSFRLPRLHRRVHEPAAGLHAGVYRRQTRGGPGRGAHPVQQRSVRQGRPRRRCRRRRWRRELRESCFSSLSLSLPLVLFFLSFFAIPCNFDLQI